MSNKFIKNIKMILLTLLTLTIFTKPVVFAANSINENTSDINISITNSEIKVSERWKIILEQDTFKRNINISEENIHSITAQLIYPTSENIAHTINSSNNGVSINLNMPNLKGREVLFTLEYTLNNSKAILKYFEKEKEVDLLYPSIETNEKPARLDIHLKSNIDEIQDREKNISNNIAIQDKKSGEGNNTDDTNKKIKNDSAKKITQSNNEKNTKNSTEIKKTKSIFNIIKSVVLDLVVLIGCTLLVSVIALFAYLIFKKFIYKNKRKFNKRNRKVKRSKRKFK